MRSKTDVQRVLSQRAHALLGHLVTLADSHGEVAVTRKKLAIALGVSTPTISRALRELRESGAIVVIAEGGGRGQPTRYRIAAFARDRVSQPGSKDNDCSQNRMVLGTATRGKRYQPDRYQDRDLDPESLRSAASEVGEMLVAATTGFFQGAWRGWRRTPMWCRMALAGAPLGTVGALIGRAQGGRMGALIGGGAGMLVGALLATLTPSDSEASPPQPHAPCPSNPLASPFNHVDPILAIIGEPPRQDLGNLHALRSHCSM